MPPLFPLPPLEQRLDDLDRAPLDVLVVGGGITGAGIALDLALRGARVAVVERNDWASATSSASSRLIHGGLRYLEQFEFALVRESCLERALLLKNAAGLVWPERFVFPLHRGDPVGRAKLAAGLLLYTAVSVPRVLGFPRLLSAAAVAQAIPGVQAVGLRGGGSYVDGATDDARLTLAVVTTAIEAGAIALSRTEARSIDAGESGAEAVLRHTLSGDIRTVQARAVVLAGGPFTDGLRARAGLTGGWVQPTRGTHLLVPRERLPTDGAVILTSGVDGRVLFLIPWPRHTVIGTTDEDASPSDPVRATRAEVRYLLDSANHLVPAAELGEADVVSTWAGLRPLLAADEAAPSARSREERIERDGTVYTIAGGKLTGYRAMAEKLCARLAGDLAIGAPGKHSPTRTRRLRGAVARPSARPEWSSLVEGRVPEPGATPTAHAWSRRYPAFAPAVEELCARVEEGRRPLDAETLLGEVDWAVRHEDCLTAEDFLLRRSDVGLGPLDAARAAAEAVTARMAALLGWDAERVALEERRTARALESAHAWRDDALEPGASSAS